MSLYCEYYTHYYEKKSYIVHNQANIYCALASGFIVILSTTRDPHKNVK